MPERPTAAGFTRAEVEVLFRGIGLIGKGYEIALEGACPDGTDRLWFRFFRPGTACPSFGFSFRDGVVRVAMRDVDGEGVINPCEPSFVNVEDALDMLQDMLFGGSETPPVRFLS